MAFLAQLGDFDAGSLDLLQRVLLVNDGTLTDTLAAAFQEQICLQKIGHEISPSAFAVAELDLPPGEMVMTRKILLKGERSGRTYVYAESRLAVDRLPERFREELLGSNVPMGRLWLEHRLETWKELLGAWRHPMGDLAAYFGAARESGCLMRRYRVISGKRPLMSIEEHFPVTYAG